MIVVNTETIAGKKVKKTLGLVRGNTIKTRWVGKDILAGLRHMVGGELVEYTEMFDDARETALTRMIEGADKLNADAVISVRFATSQVMQGAAELLAYGTAVKLE